MNDEQNPPPGWVGWTPLSGEPAPPWAADAIKNAPKPIAWVKVDVFGLEKGQCGIQVWTDNAGELKDLESRDNAARNAAYQKLLEVLQRELPEFFETLANPPAWPSE